MGCSSSKRIEATAIDVYRPPPSSFAVFDINSIQEPWLSMDNISRQNQEKPTHVPAPILEKLNKLESDAPHSWDEVSKALEDLKPTLNNKNFIALPPPTKPDTIKPPPLKDSTTQEKKQAPRKSSSFHTVEELDAKLSSKEPKPKNDLRRTESMGSSFKKTEVLSKTSESPGVLVQKETDSGKVIKPIKDNIFILRDRQEREKEGKMANYDKIKRFDPLSDYPEKIPPGGADSVVIYTTSLRGVRKTFEDCEHVRSLLEVHRVVFDERDVSLHGDFLNELRELLGEEASVPRVFVKGRYIGGVDKIAELNESGRLGRIMSWARVERGVGRQGCEGCGGARFVPCLDCGGSCKVMVDGVKERCDKCNENGLMLCPACL